MRSLVKEAADVRHGAHEVSAGRYARALATVGWPQMKLQGETRGVMHPESKAIKQAADETGVRA